MKDESIDQIIYDMYEVNMIARSTFTWYQRLLLPVSKSIYCGLRLCRNKILGERVNQWDLDEDQVYLLLEGGKERRDKKNQLFRKLHERIKYHMMPTTQKIRRL